MANIIINVAAKVFISFAPMTVNLIRNQANNVPVSLNYTNGTGQTMTANQVLYTVGTINQPGYLEVRVNSATTINNSGSVPLTVYSYPTATQANQTVTFDFDGSTITLNLIYNSLPVTSDVVISIPNRGTHDFTSQEFVNSYTDFDSDALAEIKTETPITGFLYDLNGTNNYVPYAAGTWIPVNNITRLRFQGANQNPAYQQLTPWFAKDVNGNISL